MHGVSVFVRSRIEVSKSKRLIASPPGEDMLQIRTPKSENPGDLVRLYQEILSQRPDPDASPKKSKIVLGKTVSNLPDILITTHTKLGQPKLDTTLSPRKKNSPRKCSINISREEPNAYKIIRPLPCSQIDNIVMYSGNPAPAPLQPQPHLNFPSPKSPPTHSMTKNPIILPEPLKKGYFN